ncbi:MAG: hypothetical protein U0641_17340 [Anaerolineae bacterium]
MPRFLSRLVLVLALVPILSACSRAAPDVSPVVTATTAPVAQQPPPSATAASAAPSPTTARNTATRPAVSPTARPAATKAPAATNTPAPPLPPTKPPSASPTSSDVWVPGTVDGNHIDRFAATPRLRDPHLPGAVTALTLQMLARIKGQNQDGGGIQNVKFVISDNKDEDVYQHEEDKAPFCAFQEVSGSTCRTLQMKPGLMWRKSDNGDPPKQIKSGEYTLKVTVNGSQGEAWIGTYTFKIP